MDPAHIIAIYDEMESQIVSVHFLYERAKIKLELLEEEHLSEYPSTEIQKHGNRINRYRLTTLPNAIEWLLWDIAPEGEGDPELTEISNPTSDYVEAISRYNDMM